MAIHFDIDTAATAAELQQARRLAEARKAELEQDQDAKFDRHRWAEAFELGAAIDEQDRRIRHLTRALTRGDRPLVTRPTSPALIALHKTLTREEETARQAAERAYSFGDGDPLPAFEGLLVAWRTLGAFTREAWAQTADEPFMPGHLPADPETLPMFTTLVFRRRSLGRSAPPVDRARWAHLLEARE